jgi:CRISPR-associated endonuclease/helicase Cas3
MSDIKSKGVYKLQHFWAKTDADRNPALSVVEHCSNVGEVAAALAQQIPSPIRSLAFEGVVTLASLHDIGKLSAGFQSKCEKWFVNLALSKTDEQEWSVVLV